MSDIDREFLDELEKEFDKRYTSSKKIQSLVKKIKEGKATCEDAFEYAKEVGNLRKIVLHERINDDTLNNGYLGYYNAKALFDDVLYKNYELINQYCKNTFTQVNKNAGINLNGVSVNYDQDKTNGIIECAVKGKYEDTRAETEEAVVTNAKGYYDSSVEKNARFQYKSGLRPKIIRTAVGKTCKWCQSLAGTYDYYDVSNTGNDVFRRHSNCDCLVVYSPKKGNYQDVHAKNWMDDYEYEAEKKKRIEYAEIKEYARTNPVVFSEKNSVLSNNIKNNWAIIQKIDVNEDKKAVIKKLTEWGFKDSYYIGNIPSKLVDDGSSTNVILTKGNLAYIFLRHAKQFSGPDEFNKMKDVIENYKLVLKGRTKENGDLVFYKTYYDINGNIYGMELKMNKRTGYPDEYVVHYLQTRGNKAIKKLNKYLNSMDLIDKK
ncbi:MAG: hypothetical protein IJF87_08665 [Erysipelotrichaceae bacterium]|nr:hypothetical protein [Erysipelotrichaceae bacterium]